MKFQQINAATTEVQCFFSFSVAFTMNNVSFKEKDCFLPKEKNIYKK